MNPLEILTIILLTCSTPEVDCFKYNDESEKKTRIDMCFDKPINRLPAPFSFGIVDINDENQYRYITVQPISCIEV